MKPLKSLLSAFLLAVSGILAAQTSIPGSEINGSVKDGNQKPVDYATVSLIRVADSVAVKTMMTDENGKFSFKNIPGSEYQVSVNQIGHSKYLSEKLKIDEKVPVQQLRS